MLYVVLYVMLHWVIIGYIVLCYILHYITLHYLVAYSLESLSPQLLLLFFLTEIYTQGQNKPITGSTTWQIFSSDFSSVYHCDQNVEELIQYVS